jgi:V/A-type H+-transporting ATPase subunit K
LVRRGRGVNTYGKRIRKPGGENVAIESSVAIAVAIIMVGTGIATAWAQKVIGGAAAGVMAEKPELFGKGLTMMVLPETIIILGFVIALLLMFL